MFDTPLDQPNFGSNTPGMMPLPNLTQDPDGISRLFLVDSNRLRTLAWRLDANDPSWLIPQGANTAIITNIGPDLLAYNFDDIEGELGVVGVAYLQPTYTPEGSTDSRPSNPTPLSLFVPNRASLLRLRLASESTSLAMVVWGA